MRCDKRTDPSGQDWWFVIEEETDQHKCWMYKRPHGARNAEYYLADEIWDWIEQHIPQGSFRAYPVMCAIAFNSVSQATLYRLTWGNNGPY